MVQDAVVGLVKTYGDRASFGMARAAAHEPPIVDGNEAAANQACFDATRIDVTVGRDHAGEILALLRKTTATSTSNIGDAVRRASIERTLVGHETFTPYIILFTDGNAGCNTADRGSPAAPYTVGEIAAARARGVTTLVVSLDGDGVNRGALDAMARAGGSPTHEGCNAAVRDPCFFRVGANYADFIKRVVSLPEVPPCGDDCTTLGCPLGHLCTTTRANPEPHCQSGADCSPAVCAGTTFCRDFECRNSCDDGCPLGAACKDGACVTDRCSGVRCPGAQLCRASDGACVDASCPPCRDGTRCDPDSGQCVLDWCRLITCPAGYTCTNNGNCAGPHAYATLSPGGCTCALGGGSRGHGALAGLVALVLVAALARRARQRRTAPVVPC